MKAVIEDREVKESHEFDGEMCRVLPCHKQKAGPFLRKDPLSTPHTRRRVA